MENVRNSELLEQIIAYAKAYGGGGDSALTTERYLISVIDVISEAAPIKVTAEEISRLREELFKVFPREAGIAGIKESLDKRIKEADGSSYMESIYIQQRIMKAKETAKNKGFDQLSPELLLTCILEDPTERLRSFIAGVTGEEKKPAPVSDDVLKIISEVLGGSAEEGQAKQADEPEKINPVTEDGPKLTVAKLTEKVKSIYDKLVESVYGQDNAVSVFTTGYFQAEILSMTDKKRTRPKATFLFAGPPGVGKTFLAEKAAEALELPYQRFDMSEYSDKEANIEFCGSDKVYKNGKEGNVTSFVAKNPKCVVLFDEIEKAHINVIHLFLQILDAGRIRDNFTDEEVPFTDAILIFTTNAGKQLYENADKTDFSDVTRKVILNSLQKDANPETGTPYFPAAICSRFASGNVVMFNYITAHSLREIARKEVLRHAKNFENEVGIEVNIDESVYSALLFAEGGAADARAIRSRAETFFDDELFELFRLIDSDSVSTGIENLESIHIGVELPKDDKELYELFERDETYEVLVFASEENCDQCAQLSPQTRFINAQDIDEAKKVLTGKEISFVLVDLTYGRTGNEKYLNIEDVDSKSRDFFWVVRETHPDMPIYLLQTPQKKLNAEEELSFLRQGVRGVITLSADGDGFASEIKMINEQLHQQKSMAALAKANKQVSFETAQLIEDGGKKAEIKLFDFEMRVAVDAEDSKNVLGNLSKPNVSFKQVIGAEDAKTELKYFVEYLKNPKRYMGTGVSAPKGVLLYGPPGTGKTMLAKAMAKESDVTFIATEGNQFLKQLQGQGPEKVREIFRTARKYAPSILFIDEVDAIATERRGDSNGTEATLTTFLAEMDGFKNDTTKPVFVLAATNYDVEPGGPRSLDPAFVRRFDRHLFIDLPNRGERIEYIKQQIEGKPAFELTEEKINNISIRSTGMSLASLHSVIELSLRTAIRDGNLKVTDDIFEEAFETFNGGKAKNWNESTLERTARHEAGHAFLCWQSGETPSYVTIVARGDHGGYMQHDDNEGKGVYTKDELLSKIRVSLGGRAAEIVYYGDKDGISTGASGDLYTATSIAQHIICTYGMDEQFGLAVIDPQAARDGELSIKVRDAVNKILDRELKNAIKLIEENKSKIDALVLRLLSDNHLSGDEIKAVFENEPAHAE